MICLFVVLFVAVVASGLGAIASAFVVVELLDLSVCLLGLWLIYWLIVL